MEEKHIYSPSRWKHFQDKFNSFKTSFFKDFENLYSDFVKFFYSLKRRVSKTKESIEEKKQAKAKTRVIVSQVLDEEPSQPQTSKAKKISKTKKIPIETEEKLITFILLFLIVLIIALGIYLSSKGS